MCIRDRNIITKIHPNKISPKKGDKK